MDSLPQKPQVDRKDRAILEILARNCRVPLSVIGKAIHSSQDAVAYRIKALEESGVLSQWMLFIDARRLGFTRYHLLMRFVSGQIEKEKICQRIMQHPFVMWINTFIGRYDIQVIVDAKDPFQLQLIKEDLLKACATPVQEYSVLTHLADYEFTQLSPLIDLGTKFRTDSDRSFSAQLSGRNFPVEMQFTSYTPNALELEILKALSNNPRASLSATGRMLGCDRQTVKSRILNLIKHKVILNFGGIPSLEKLGFVTYYLLVRISEDTPLSLIKTFFSRLRNIFYAGRMLGDFDMILYLNARSPQELNASIALFRSALGKYILYYELLVQDKVHYWRQFTQGIYEGVKEREGRSA